MPTWGTSEPCATFVLLSQANMGVYSPKGLKHTSYTSRIIRRRTTSWEACSWKKSAPLWGTFEVIPPTKMGLMILWRRNFSGSPQVPWLQITCPAFRLHKKSLLGLGPVGAIFPFFAGSRSLQCVQVSPSGLGRKNGVLECSRSHHLGANDVQDRQVVIERLRVWAWPCLFFHVALATDEVPRGISHSNSWCSKTMDLKSSVMICLMSFFGKTQPWKHPEPCFVKQTLFSPKVVLSLLLAGSVPCKRPAASWLSAERSRKSMQIREPVMP